MSDSISRLDGNPLMQRLRAAMEASLQRTDRTEPTFRCPVCCDIGFLTRADSQGRIYGCRCQCLLDDIANKPKAAGDSLKFKTVHRPISDDDDGLPF